MAPENPEKWARGAHRRNAAKKKAYSKQPRRAVAHGELHDKQNKRWCTVHKRWFKEPRWDKHKMCDLTKEKRAGHGLRVTHRRGKGKTAAAEHNRVDSILRTKEERRRVRKSKPKRTSDALHYCSKHGPFKGYSWGGHRRVCQRPEMTQAEYLTRDVSDSFGKYMDAIGIQNAHFSDINGRTSLLVTKPKGDTLKKGEHIVAINTESPKNRHATIEILRKAIEKGDKTVSLLIYSGDKMMSRIAPVPLEWTESTAAPMVDEVLLKKKESHVFVKSEDLLIKAGQSLNERLEKAKKVLSDLEQQKKDLDKRVDMASDMVDELENKQGNFYLKVEELAKEVSSN